MAPNRSLSKAEVDTRMHLLPSWTHQQNCLQRSFTFSDFVAAFGFMASVALVAERLGHHPDWRNVFNQVHVTLSTHDLGGISDNDFKLAAAMDQIFRHTPAA